MSEDYYTLLGVSKGATKDEIKKAYRQKAKEHHPDKGGDEKKFKKIQEAYDVLSSDQKRAEYDQFGAAGRGGQGFGGGGRTSGFSASDFQDFGGFEDIFSSFFGGGFQGGGRTKRSHSNRGSDLEVEVELNFEEAIKGTEKTFSSRQYIVCEKCEGKGGQGAKTCSTCRGSGSVSRQFQTPFGAVAQRTACPNCQGQGITFEKTCSACGGEGRKEGKTKISFSTPAGVEDGATLKFSEKGEAGIRGGQSGDLYVHVRVRPSEEFQRQGLDLMSPLKISVFDALLGGKFEVQTFWGKGTVTVPENTRDGQLLRIRGKGVRQDGKVGDHIVRIRYEMPRKMSRKMKEMLEQLKKE